METAQVGIITTKRKRKSRRVAKSTVSARLLPGFDINKLLKSEETTKYSNSDLDPKTLKFDRIVQLLQPKFMSNYLSKILDYLSSENKELCFPQLDAFKEEFLVRIVDSERNLQCKHFNKECESLGKVIIGVLNDQKDYYKWSCSFEDGRIVRKVLVYRKIYLDSKDTHQAQPTDSSVIISASPTQDDTTHNISTAFKVQILNATIKFLKDDDQMKLEYPKMTVAEAEFVHSLIHERGSDDVGFGFKCMYAPLHEALKTLSKKYFFNVSFCRGYKETSAHIVFQKDPKPGTKLNNTDNQDNTKERPDNKERQSNVQDSLCKIQEFPNHEQELQDNNQDSQFEKKLCDNEKEERQNMQGSQHNMQGSQDNMQGSQDNMQRQSIIQKHQKHPECDGTPRSVASGKSLGRCKQPPVVETDSEAKNELLANVSQKYIIDALQRMSLFLKDESSASLEFSDATLEQTRFLQRAMARAHSKEYHKSFDEQCVVLLKRLARRYSDRQWRVQVDEGKLQRNGLRKVTFFKTPYYSNNPTINLSKKKTKDDSLEEESTRSVVIVTVTSNKGRESVKQSRSISEIRSQAPRDRARRSDSADRAKSQGAAMVKERLLKGLATPLESDVAERMMRAMGWEGGGLGVRGNGIVEPIAPTLGVPPRSGLGHASAPRCQSLHPVLYRFPGDGKCGARSPHEFRMQFLEGVLELARQKGRETTLEFHPALRKKEINFVEHMLRGLNNGKTSALTIEEEIPLLLSVTEEVRRRQIVFAYSVNEDKTRITFTRSHASEAPELIIPVEPKKTKHKPKLPSKLPATVTQDTITKEEIKSLVTSIAIEDNSAVDVIHILACKITILAKIHDFLTLPDASKMYVFEDMPLEKLHDYVNDVVSGLNRRAAKDFTCVLEDDIYQRLRAVICSFHLTVACSENKMFMHKNSQMKKIKHGPQQPSDANKV